MCFHNVCFFLKSLLKIEEVKKPLEDYCEEHFGEIVKIYRAPKRLGLIAGKNYGSKLTASLQKKLNLTIV